MYLLLGSRIKLKKFLESLITVIVLNLFFGTLYRRTVIRGSQYINETVILP